MLTINSVGTGTPACHEGLYIRRLNQYSCVLMEQNGTRLLADPAKLSTNDVPTIIPDILLVSHESMDHLDIDAVAYWASIKPLHVFASAGAWLVLKRSRIAFAELQMAVPGHSASCLRWRMSFGRSNHGYYLEPIIALIELPCGARVMHAFDSEVCRFGRGDYDVGIFPAGIAPGVSVSTFIEWTQQVLPRFAVSNHHLESAVSELAMCHTGSTRTIALPWNGWVCFDIKPSLTSDLPLSLEDTNTPLTLLELLSESCDGSVKVRSDIPNNTRSAVVGNAVEAQQFLCGNGDMTRVTAMYESGLQSNDGAIQYSVIEMMGWCGTYSADVARVVLDSLCSDMCRFTAAEDMPVRRKLCLEIMRIVRMRPCLAPMTRNVMLWACKDVNPDIRGVAISVLAIQPSIDDDPEAISALVRSVDDDDLDVCCAGVRACISLKNNLCILQKVLPIAKVHSGAPPPLGDICRQVLDAVTETDR